MLLEILLLKILFALDDVVSVDLSNWYYIYFSSYNNIVYDDYMIYDRFECYYFMMSQRYRDMVNIDLT